MSLKSDIIVKFPTCVPVQHAQKGIAEQPDFPSVKLKTYFKSELTFPKSEVRKITFLFSTNVVFFTNTQNVITLLLHTDSKHTSTTSIRVTVKCIQQNTSRQELYTAFSFSFTFTPVSET